MNEWPGGTGCWVNYQITSWIDSNLAENIWNFFLLTMKYKLVKVNNLPLTAHVLNECSSGTGVGENY